MIALFLPDLQIAQAMQTGYNNPGTNVAGCGC
jgi:hypothetical protein